MTLDELAEHPSRVSLGDYALPIVFGRDPALALRAVPIYVVTALMRFDPA
jgi:hypothetical protein